MGLGALGGLGALLGRFGGLAGVGCPGRPSETRVQEANDMSRPGLTMSVHSLDQRLKQIETSIRLGLAFCRFQLCR